MKNMTKGALAMVFAGAITFSVANAWLDGEPTKLLLTKVKTITESLNRKMADHPNLIEKKKINQKTEKTVENLTSSPSQNKEALQTSNESPTVRVNSSSPKSSAESSAIPVTPHLSNKVSAQSVTQKGTTQRPRSTPSTRSATTKTTNKNASGSGKTAATSVAATAHGAHSTTKTPSAKSTHSQSTTGGTTNLKTNHGTQVSSVEKQKHVTSQPAQATNNGKKQ